MNILPLSIEDYDDVYTFWKTIPEMGLSSADNKEGIAAYIMRNPGMSMVVKNDAGSIIGTVLCGHDGRRGYIHHLAVAAEYRGKSMGQELVNRCIESLREEKIQKCHIFIFVNNESGKEFWRSVDWTERTDICLFSHDIDYPNC